MYRLSVADTHVALGEERYVTLASAGADSDWQELAIQIIDVLNALSARLVSDSD
jgi:hypothetical protein